MDVNHKASKREYGILGIRIDNFTREEINNWVKNTLDEEPRQKFVTTLNPEIILEGYREKDFAEVLNSADLNLSDGFGIKFISFLKGRKIKSRYTGVDLVDYLLKTAKEKKLRVFVAVSKDSLSRPEEIERRIEKEFGFHPQAKYWNGENFFESENVKSAEIVLVNFGAPGQEKFIFDNRSKFPQAKILAGVGGTFDFLTGRMKRAPRGMRKAGLEWLFRLWQEPKRAKRIWNAVVVFPILALFKAKNDV